MNDDDLLRYSRHLLLDEIGIEGQDRLLAARALVIGAGGLGSPAAMFLGSAGVGRITLVDDDTVDLTNLQRQLAHTHARIGQPKVASAREALLALNPTLDVRTLRQRADAALLAALVAEADVALDCSDNFATRQALNAACVAAGVPLVAGAAIAFDGQVQADNLFAIRTEDEDVRLADRLAEQIDAPRGAGHRIDDRRVGDKNVVGIARQVDDHRFVEAELDALGGCRCSDLRVLCLDNALHIRSDEQQAECRSHDGR